MIKLKIHCMGCTFHFDVWKSSEELLNYIEERFKYISRIHNIHPGYIIFYKLFGRDERNLLRIEKEYSIHLVKEWFYNVDVG